MVLPPAMNTPHREELHRKALRLLGEHHRLLKLAKTAPVASVRAHLLRRAEAIAREAKVACDDFYGYPDGMIPAAGGAQ